MICVVKPGTDYVPFTPTCTMQSPTIASPTTAAPTTGAPTTASPTAAPTASPTIAPLPPSPPPYAPASFTVVVTVALGQDAAANTTVDDLGAAVSDSIIAALPADERNDTTVAVLLDETTFLVFGVANTSTYNATAIEAAIRDAVCAGAGLLTCTVTVSLGSRRRLDSGAGTVEATVERQTQYSADRSTSDPIDGAAVASSIQSETGTATTLQEESQIGLSATASVEQMRSSAQSAVDESLSPSALADEVAADIGVPASAVTVTQTLATPPPPPSPPANGDPTVEVVIVAGGDVSDYPPAVLNVQESLVADAAGVGASQVRASVQPASVIITFVVSVPPSTSVGAVSSGLSSALGTPALASSLLGIQVSSVDIDDGTDGAGGGGGGGGGLSIGVVAGAAAGGVIAVLLVAFAIYYLRGRAPSSGHGKASSGAMKMAQLRSERVRAAAPATKDEKGGFDNNALKEASAGKTMGGFI